MLPAGPALERSAFERLASQRAPDFGLTLSPSSLRRLSGFLAELDLARRTTNLTGPMEAGELVDHALESAIAEDLIADDARVIDIGSGAGFPGLPLAAIRRDIRLTAVEPRKKRIEFLRLAAAVVPLPNVAVEPSLSRLGEAWADVATARAVGSIDRILGEARFLRPKGLFLAWTTDPSALARALARRFVLEGTREIPQSRRKVIAVFRKVDVPRGTSHRKQPKSKRSN